MLRALQPGTSTDSAGALCQRADSSPRSTAWRPGSSGRCSVSAAGTAGTAGTAGATELHCSASSCCSDAAAMPDGARKHRQAAAGLLSADEDDGGSSVGALGRTVGSPFIDELFRALLAMVCR